MKEWMNGMNERMKVIELMYIGKLEKEMMEITEDEDAGGK